MSFAQTYFNREEREKVEAYLEKNQLTMYELLRISVLEKIKKGKN